MSQEECARLRESVPYVKLYRYNPKHLYPNLNCYGDNDKRRGRSSCGSTYYACSADALRLLCACPCDWNAVNIVPALRSVSYLYAVAKVPFMFSRVEYCDMHFVYGFRNCNARAAVEEYQRRFPDRRIPSRGVFKRIHQTMRETGCLPSVAV